jgi:hypothetical protein
VFAFQHGGIVPVGYKTDAVPAIVHRGEEVLTPSDPRHSFNVGKQQSQQAAAAAGPVSLAVHFTANGRLTQGEIREHSMTIAKQVSRIFDEHPTTRPTY